MDLLKSLCRQGVICSSNDAKERTPDLLEQFYHDKELKEGSFNIEINLRKQADKYIKDGEVFVIRWVCIPFLALPTLLTNSKAPKEERSDSTMDEEGRDDS
jgi:hypothetical protein